MDSLTLYSKNVQNGGVSSGGIQWQSPQFHDFISGPPPSMDATPIDLIREWPSVRPSSGYDEQQALLTVWFSVWPSAERLICLSRLLDRMSDVESRLQHKPVILMKEARANNPETAYQGCSSAGQLSDLSSEFLMEHLPLLSLTSHECKPLYLSAAVRCVQAALRTVGAAGGGPPAAARLEQARQLLGILAVHPVLTREDKRILHGLFFEFGDAYSGGGGGGGGGVSIAPSGIGLDSGASSRRVSPVNRRSPLFESGHQLQARRHSACAAIGGELRVPSPSSVGRVSPQDTSSPGTPLSASLAAAAWHSRNLLSPNDRGGGYSLEERHDRLRSSSLTPPSGANSASSADIASSPFGVNKPRSSSVHLDHSPLAPGSWSMGPPSTAAAAGGLVGAPAAAAFSVDTFVTPSSSASQHLHHRLLNSTGRRYTSYGGGVGVQNPPHRSSSHSNLSDASRDRSFSTRGSGMTTVPKWLHKLRLHKYTWIFAGLSYEQLFDLQLERLLALGVTQGGANKLLRYIHELPSRHHKLRELLLGLSENRIPLSTALEQMEVLVVSPMRPRDATATFTAPTPTADASGALCSTTGTPLIRVTQSDDAESTASTSGDKPSEGDDGASQEVTSASSSAPATSSSDQPDLPAMMTQVLAKMCTQLLVAPPLSSAAGQEGDDSVQMFLWLLDEATWQEAFTDAQRRKFVTWKRQISLELGRKQVFPSSFRRHSEARQYNGGGPSSLGQRRYSDARGGGRYPSTSRGGSGSFSFGFPSQATAAPASGGGAFGHWGYTPGVVAQQRGVRNGTPAPSMSAAFPRRTSLQEGSLALAGGFSSLYGSSAVDSGGGRGFQLPATLPSTVHPHQLPQHPPPTALDQPATFHHPLSLQQPPPTLFNAPLASCSGQITYSPARLLSLKPPKLSPPPLTPPEVPPSTVACGGFGVDGLSTAFAAIDKEDDDICPHIRSICRGVFDNGTE